MGEKIDIAIISALEVESKAINSRAKFLRKVDSENFIFFKGEYWNKHYGEYYNIIHYTIDGVGNVKSGLIAQKLKDFNPKYIFMVGIGGGIEKNNVKIGDIVVSKEICYYSLSAIENNSTEIRLTSHQCDPALVSQIKNFRDSEDVAWVDNFSRIDDYRKDFKDFPKVHFGSVLSGESVVKSINQINKLLIHSPKALAIEMESWGIIMSTFHSLKDSCFIAIRGISDLATKSKNDKFHEFAANIAAEFLFYFLTNGLLRPIEKYDFELKDQIVSRGISLEIANALLKLQKVRISCSDIIEIKGNFFTADILIKKMNGKSIAIIGESRGKDFIQGKNGLIGILSRLTSGDIHDMTIIILTEKSETNLMFKTESVKCVHVPKNSNYSDIINILGIEEE